MGLRQSEQRTTNGWRQRQTGFRVSPEWGGFGFAAIRVGASPAAG
ncbi:hypothetical protein GLE_5096 [Lysobacter enzymogenes]|uniref:Uncharacterized protein n=1 Tax=Lysobacter enzymogenes TaxID=69 RepID=A0A0S2DPR0_LYSEN|nr:hypothetical protein GLE_5096 [Lysobacter enzymogenes]